jgi:hypothetical protein
VRGACGSRSGVPGWQFRGPRFSPLHSFRCKIVVLDASKTKVPITLGGGKSGPFYFQRVCNIEQLPRSAQRYSITLIDPSRPSSTSVFPGLRQSSGYAPIAQEQSDRARSLSVVDRRFSGRGVTGLAGVLAIASVRRVTRHNDVAAAQTEEPLSPGHQLHEFEIISFGAISASDRIGHLSGNAQSCITRLAFLR